MEVFHKKKGVYLPTPSPQERGAVADVFAFTICFYKRRQWGCFIA
jgi:hypothetical protein